MTWKGFAWTRVNDQARSCDGRLDCQQLKQHYLGDSFMGKIKLDADQKLENANFGGKARNFTFENYCEKLKRAFTDLDECGDELTDDCKVRCFMRGLSDPILQTAKLYIIGSHELKSSLETAMNYVSQTWNEQEPMKLATGTMNISSSDTGGRGHEGKGRGRGRGGHGRGG